MKVSRPAYAGGNKRKRKRPNGAARLTVALARVLRRTRDPLPQLPTPGDPWSHAVEERLAFLEQKLNGQNRLLIITIISVTADLLYGVVKQ